MLEFFEKSSQNLLAAEALAGVGHHVALSVVGADRLPNSGYMRAKIAQEKLIKFATRIPAFMYLTDFRENTLQDVITKLEPELFQTVTGLSVADFHLLVRLKVFNTERMNEAVFAFRRYEDASLRYTGIDSHEGLTRYGLYDTVIAKEISSQAENIAA